MWPGSLARRRKGILFIVSAPSGAGKTTLIKKLLKLFPDIALSVSHTTRSPRPGEIAGKDYHFVSARKFLALRARSGFAEWALVHGSLYGTPSASLERRLRRGRDVLLDIDVQGARKIKRQYPDAVSIFVLPPSLSELEHRLARRGTDRREIIRKRLENARREIREMVRYDYVVVNRELRRAVQGAEVIVRAERLRVSRWKSVDR
jgi:guanylate kinase